MAEYLDVHLFHMADEGPDIWFTDDKGERVDVVKVSDEELNDGWEQVYRIQHDQINKL